MSLSTDTKDLQMGDGYGDTKDMGAGVTDEVTISPTGAELAILANDAHRLVHSRLQAPWCPFYSSHLKCDQS